MSRRCTVGLFFLNELLNIFLWVAVASEAEQTGDALPLPPVIPV